MKIMVRNWDRVVVFLLWLLLLGWGALHWGRTEKLEGQLYFRMDLSLVEAGFAKIFFSRDGVFSEENSNVVRVDATDHFSNAVLRLPVNQLEWLRIDPVDNASGYRFGRMEITNGNGTTVCSFDVERLVAGNELTRYEIRKGVVHAIEQDLTSDPSFILQLNPPVTLAVPEAGAWVRRAAMAYAFPVAVVLVLFLWGGLPAFYGVITLFFWMVFDPGFYSPDSIDQIIQANRGVYWNQHPPLVAFILRMWFFTGLGIREWMFFQGLMGVMAIRWFILRGLSTLSGKTTVRQMEFIVLVIVLILMNDGFPLRYYLNTLWKDSWACIQFVALGGVLMDLARRWKGGGRLEVLGLCSAVVLMFFIVLTRYNAIVLVPVFSIIIGLMLFQQVHWRAVPLGVILFLGLLVAKPMLHRALHVREFPIENQMLTLDLIGFYAKYPDLRHEMPYTSANLKEDWQERFEWANIYPISFDRPLIVTEEYGSYIQENPELKDEYQRVFWSHPLRMLWVKGWHMVHLLGWESTHYWYHDHIAPNELSLSQNPQFAGERAGMFRRSHAVSTSGWRWVSGVHLPWILVNVAALCYAAWSWVRKPDSMALFRVLMCLIPLMYYGSYFISSPARDFRYMYPATLLVQLFAIIWVVRVVFLAWDRWSKGRAEIHTI
jgi:hypothetical protein